MKNTFKKLQFIALIFFIISIILCSCENGIPESTEPALTTAEQVTEAIEETAASPQAYELIRGGECLYKIVYPSDLPTDSAEVKAALSIRKAIEKFSTTGIEITDDLHKDTEKLEILIGFTGYEESRKAAEGLGYGDFAIKTVGNKIVLISYSEQGIAQAAERLVSLIYSGASDSASQSGDVTILTEYINFVRSFDSKASAIPVYQGGESYISLDISEGCYGIIVSNTTTEEYNNYLTILAEDGYTTHATNEIAGSFFTTVYTNEYTINAGYYNNLDEVRIILEPYEDDTLAPKKSDFTPITTTQITMLGVDGIYNGGYQHNGMCLIYRLADGSFIVIDGGHSGNSAIYANNIIKELRAQSADYAKTDKDIRIASWIITHPHADHHGTLLNEYKKFTGFTFESIMCSFWTQAAFEESQNANADFASGSWKGYLRSRNIAEEIGADFIVPHVGQVFWYADTAFEILYTIESYMPKVATGFNTCSLVFRTITTDKSGKSTTVMVTGDATGHAFEICTTMYGKELICDILQVAHHGAGTGGANSQTIAAYTIMKPAVILWPAGTHNYADKAKKDWNQVLTSRKNPNYAELYVSGWQGNAVTLSLPYTLGTATINEVLEP